MRGYSAPRSLAVSSRSAASLPASFPRTSTVTRSMWTPMKGGCAKAIPSDSSVAQCCDYVRISIRSRGFASTALRQARTELPSKPARTRFAPSPTGYLHLGSIRTALFNYLLAKKTGGQFLLRIEDTDQRRTVADAEQRLCRDLRWAGLQWDEGPEVGGTFGPYRQSERTHIYKRHAEQLVENGRGYRCFCSAERLEELSRARQRLGLPTDYDRQCAGISKDESDERASAGQPYVVRLLVPQRYPEFRDMIYGRIGRDRGDNLGIVQKYGEIAYEDPILLKTDGQPTYHLANVVDDHLMNITHVIRATEWISSTPKHLSLYQAFGWQPPAFAHVGLLVNDAGQKLSKRDGHTDVTHFRDKGILPAAMANFVALLGWSHGKRSDVMDLLEMVDNFQFKFTKGNTTVNTEKLWYLQRAHAARMASDPHNDLQPLVDSVCGEVYQRFGTNTAPDSSPLASYVSRLVRVDARNYTNAEEFVTRNQAFFKPAQTADWPPPEEQNDLRVPLVEYQESASKLLDGISTEDWDEKHISEWIQLATNKHASEGSQSVDLDQEEYAKRWYKQFCHFLRWVCLYGNKGPGVAATMSVLGRDVCKKRFEAALESLSLRNAREAGVG